MLLLLAGASSDAVVVTTTGRRAVRRIPIEVAEDQNDVALLLLVVLE